MLSLDQRINALLTGFDQLHARREQHYLRALRHQPTTQTIQRVVARHYGVSVIDLVSARRTQPLAFVRQIAIYLVRELTALSMPSIGRLFGDRDHTTILHAVRKVQARRERDPALAATLQKLAAAVAAGGGRVGAWSCGRHGILRGELASLYPCGRGWIARRESENSPSPLPSPSEDKNSLLGEAEREATLGDDT